MKNLLNEKVGHLGIPSNVLGYRDISFKNETVPGKMGSMGTR
jgi:hypothetical protein